MIVTLKIPINENQLKLVRTKIANEQGKELTSEELRNVVELLLQAVVRAVVSDLKSFEPIIKGALDGTN